MEKLGLAVVLGDSLLMDSVGTNLRNGLALRVIRVDASNSDIGEYIKSLKPELVVFELDNPRPCAIFSMLREQPGILFLGIDTKDSQVIALNSNRHPIENMQEFCQLAQTKLEYEAHIRKGGNETDMMDTCVLSEPD